MGNWFSEYAGNAVTSAATSTSNERRTSRQFNPTLDPSHFGKTFSALQVGRSNVK